MPAISKFGDDWLKFIRVLPMIAKLNFSLRTLYNAGIMLMFLALFIVGAASLNSLSTAIDLSNEIVEKSLSDIHNTMTLRLTLSQAAMPVNDHVIHADPIEQENFDQLSGMVERHFDTMDSSVTLNVLQRDSLDLAREKWNQAKKIGDAIMRTENPVGNSETAKQMERFDLIIDNAIDILSDLYGSIYLETVKSHEKLHEIESRALIFIVVLAILALILVIFGSLLLAKSFFPPVRRMLNGVRMFSEGRLDHRIDEDMPKEFEELAYGINTMAGKLEQIHLDLKDAAIHDELTGCFNRRQLEQDVISDFSQARRTGESLCLLMLDIDFFKKINDSYGHAAGDEVLRSVAASIGKELRQHEQLYRYGGEEFTIMLPAAPQSDAQRLAERIRSTIASRPIDVGSAKPINVTISIGVTSYPDSAFSVKELFEQADQALYEAKESGRNRVHVYEAEKVERGG